MSVTLLKSSQEEAVISIKIDAQTIENAIMKQYKVAMEGMEQDAPTLPLSNQKLLSLHPQTDIWASQVLNEMLPVYYNNAISELKLKPMAIRQIKPKKTKIGEPYVVEIRVALAPEIELKEYEGLKVSYTPVIATDEDVITQIASMREQHGTGDDDDALLKRLSFDSMEQLKTEVRKTIEAQAEEKTELNKKTAVLKTLIDTNPCVAPEEVIEQQLMVQLDQLHQQLGEQGMNKYLKDSDKTIKDIKTEMRPETEVEVKKNLLLTAIAENKNFKVTEDEVKQILLKQSRLITDPSLSYEDFRKRAEETPGVMDHFNRSILIEKTIAYIIKHAVFQKLEPQRVLN
ncbi:trigger factor protein (TF) [Desulfuromusa kysingii]|uniref:Trigger factor protein (TF) n=1 Tax=Desulfuromusa kysingii TaxID=37625 RepID=A0A1H4A470_9BACT|nr:trigger factor [Desulfuromusa kysingii]SEA30451.1 trigger factor protein (TF) [Desulfuromusa kysingii]